MLRRIIKTTEILYTAYFMTPLKGVITVQEKVTFTAWQKLVETLLTSAWLKVFLLHVIMVVYWITVRSVAFR